MNTTHRSNLFAAIILFAFMIGSIILSFIPGIKQLPILFIQVMIEIIFLVLPTIIYLIVTKSPVKKTLRLNWPGLPTVILSFLVGIFILPLVMFISSLANLFVTNDVPFVMEKIISSPTLALLAVIALTPAICEELPLRGVLLSGYDQIDIKRAILINGLFFGIIHLNLHQFSYAFVLGVIFAYIVRLTNSIFPSMIMHFTINGSTVLFQKLLFKMMELYPDLYADAATTALEASFTEKLQAVGVTFALALLITPVAGLFLYFMHDIHQENYKKYILLQDNTIIKEPIITQNKDFPETESLVPTEQTAVTTEAEPSRIKVLNWPVWLSIIAFVIFMVATALFE